MGYFFGVDGIIIWRQLLNCFVKFYFLILKMYFAYGKGIIDKNKLKL